MANYVTKEGVKAFVRDVRIEMDARNAAKFAPAATLANVKNDLNTLEDDLAPILADKALGKGLSANDFTNEEKEFLAELAETSKANEEGFDATDVLDIFDD